MKKIIKTNEGKWMWKEVVDGSSTGVRSTKDFDTEQEAMNDAYGTVEEEKVDEVLETIEKEGVEEVDAEEVSEEESEDLITS